MAHRKWKETKLQPSMLPGPAVPGCSIVSLHFLWAILFPQAVHCIPKKSGKTQRCTYFCCSGGDCDRRGCGRRRQRHLGGGGRREGRGGAEGARGEGYRRSSSSHDHRGNDRIRPITQLRGSGGRFGDNLCVDCANSPYVGGRNQFTNT